MSTAFIADGCMRTYLILKEKVEKFNADSEIQGLIQEIREDDDELDALRGSYSSDAAEKVRNLDLDPDQLHARPIRYEKLDQLTNELLMGLR